VEIDPSRCEEQPVRCEGLPTALWRAIFLAIKPTFPRLVALSPRSCGFFERVASVHFARPGARRYPLGRVRKGAHPAEKKPSPCARG
jgi:hypothetical protein